MLGKSVKVIEDRPKGSVHPKYKETTYPINYGYIPGILAPDGEELDAYILGVDKPIVSFEGIVIGIIHRNNDVEEKLVVAPFDVQYSYEEILAEVAFMEQYFDFKLIV